MTACKTTNYHNPNSHNLNIFQTVPVIVLYASTGAKQSKVAQGIPDAL